MHILNLTFSEHNVYCYEGFLIKTDTVFYILPFFQKATKLMWERVKLCVEPSGAVGVAAVLSDKFKSLPPSIKKVGIILSGGNMDLSKLSSGFSRK